MGELPRHYVLTAHGPALVFRRSDIERWRSEHRRRRAAAPAPATTVMQDAVHDAVRQMNAVLTTSRAAMTDVLQQLERHEQQLAFARASINRLMAQLDHGEGAAGEAATAVTDGAGANHYGKPSSVSI
jgi:hypothetical protein